MVLKTNDIWLLINDLYSVTIVLLGFLPPLISHFLPQSSEGFLNTGVRPQSFPNESLLCKVEVGNDDYNDVPKGWIYERAYREHYARFRQV